MEVAKGVCCRINKNFVPDVLFFATVVSEDESVDESELSVRLSFDKGSDIKIRSLQILSIHFGCTC